MPINSAILYTRIDDIGVQIENEAFFKFINIVEYINDLMKMGGVQQCRPRMRPITDRVAHRFSKEMGYSPAELNRLDYLRKLIVKEYYRFFIWFGLSDKFSDIESCQDLDVETAIVYNYKMGSLFYQLYYGET
jgi:hypothetical protein